MTAMKKKTNITKTVKSKSNEDVFVMYLRDMEHIPLLNREEEIKAAKAAVKGDMTARNRLANGNLRFVIKIAKKYQGRGLPLADLISEGNVGLMQAIDRYDVDMGCRFITFAVWWIRQSIVKAINDKSRMIRLPVNRINDLIHITRARKVIGENLGSEREIREIAALLNMEKEYVEDMINISRDMVSLEKIIYMEDHSSTLGDFIEDEQYDVTPDQVMFRDALKKEIESLLSTLNEQEATIIRERFGLGESYPSTLEELGYRYNLTRERIRQIEAKALNNLQNTPQLQRLAACVA